MSVIVIPPNVHDIGGMLLDRTQLARDVRGPAQEALSAGNATAQALAAVPATPDTPPVAVAELGLAHVFSLGLLLMPPAKLAPAEAQEGPHTAIAKTDRRWMTLKVGEAVARSLNIPPQDHTPEALSALGEHTLLEGAASSAGIDVPLLIVAARAAGFVDDASLQDIDPDTLADKLNAFIRKEFSDEIAFYESMDALADLHIPTRHSVARDVMAAAGLNPDQPAITRNIVESPLSTAVGNSASAGSRTATPAQRYVARDTLGEEDLATMWTRGNAHLTSEQTQGMLARLPPSLNAEFDRRFDAYTRDTAAQTAILVRTRLALHARKNGMDLSSAAISVYRPRLEDYIKEVLPIRGGAVRYAGKTRTVIPAQGYVYAIQSGDMQRRFFLSSKTGVSLELPAEMSTSAWVDANRAAVFGDAAFAPPAQWLIRRRLAIEDIGSGNMSTLGESLSASFRNEIEKSRETARGQTTGEQITEFLLDLIPFRSMIQAIRRDDVLGALISGGLDVMSLLPLVLAGLRLANVGFKAGKQGVAAAVAALRAPPLGTVANAAATRMAGRASRHGLSNLATTLRNAVCGKVKPTTTLSWSRLVSLDPEQLSARMRAAHPAMASKLQAASRKLRGAAIADGQWRVQSTPAVMAANLGDDGVRTLHATFARDRIGRRLPLQQLGHTRAYTRIDVASGKRISGAVLLAGPDDVLYRSLPLDTLQRYRVAKPDLLARLQGQRVAANGTVALHGKAYARIAGEHIEVAIDMGTSTALRPIWHPVPPDGTAPDVIVHRVAYDPDRALWRQADIPQLGGGGRVPNVSRGDWTATSSSGVSSGEASPQGVAPFGASTGIAPGQLQLSLQPFGHGIRTRYPSLIGHARKNYFVQGPDGQVRRFPSGYSGGTVTPELLDGEFVRSMGRIMDYSHANALGEVLAGYRHDAASAAVSYRVGGRAVSSHDTARAVYSLREGPHAQYMIPATDHLGEADACAQMLLAEGKTPAQVMEQVNKYQQLRLQFPLGADAHKDMIMPMAAQLKGAPVTTYMNGVSHDAAMQSIQRALQADAPVILFRQGKAVVLDAIETDAQGTWLTIRHPSTASQVRIRDHKEFWLGDDRSRTVTPTPADFELNDIRVVTIEHEHRARHLRTSR